MSSLAGCSPMLTDSAAPAKRPLAMTGTASMFLSGVSALHDLVGVNVRLVTRKSSRHR